MPIRAAGKDRLGTNGLSNQANSGVAFDFSRIPGEIKENQVRQWWVMG